VCSTCSTYLPLPVLPILLICVKQRMQVPLQLLEVHCCVLTVVLGAVYNKGRELDNERQQQQRRRQQRQRQQQQQQQQQGELEEDDTAARCYANYLSDAREHDRRKERQRTAAEQQQQQQGLHCRPLL
jgi:signal transduction histidine kinase